jgi:hypothetical protein
LAVVQQSILARVLLCQSNPSVIEELVKENGVTGMGVSIVNTSASGVEAAPGTDVQSPEAYIGYRQAERFASPERQG